MSEGIKKYGRFWRVDARSVLKYWTPRKVLNAVRTEWAFRRQISDIRVRPYVMIIEPLYYCNLRCPLCARETAPDARKGKEAAGKLSLELFDQVMDEIGPDLFQLQIFGNGEPLLDWPRTQEMIRRAHARRIYTLLSTNCTLVTPKIAEELIGSDLDYLICGIDGITQASYEAYRVGGDVKDALGGLRLLVEERRRQRRRVHIEWQFLINRFNAHEMPEVQKLAEELGVSLRMTPISGIEGDDELRKKWHADAARAALGEETACCGTDCVYLWRAITLNSNGQLARCNFFSNVAQMGHVGGRSIVDMFNDPSTRRARQLFSRQPVPDGDYPWPCNNCAYYKRRRGGADHHLVVQAENRVTLPILGQKTITSALPDT